MTAFGLLIAGAASLTATAVLAEEGGVPAAPAQDAPGQEIRKEVHEDNQAIRAKNKEIREDRKEFGKGSDQVKGDRAELQKDRADRRALKKERRKDRREMRREHNK